MKPFLFERSFDAFDTDRHAAIAAADAGKTVVKTGEDAKAPPEHAEPARLGSEGVHTEEDMAAAKREAYMNGHADGVRKGHAEAMDTLARQLNTLLEELVPAVSDLGRDQALANERAQANMARIVRATMTRLMPVYLAKHGADEALAVVSDCLAELQDPGRLTVRLPEGMADLLGDRLSKVAERAGFEGQIRLLTDGTLGPSDVRVDWGAGGAERRYESIQAEIDAAIDRAVARAEAQLAGRGEGRAAEVTARTEEGAAAAPEEVDDPPPETAMGMPEADGSAPDDLSEGT